jgi:Polysaccharide lyase
MIPRLPAWLVVAALGGPLVASCGSSKSSTVGISTPRPVVAASHPTPGIVFSGNWETGDISQWHGAQCANTGPVGGSYGRGTINIVTEPEPVAQGKYAARFDLPADTTSNNACEVGRKRTEALGTDDWYALEVYFPSNWQEPSSAFWGLAFAQFNYAGIEGAPVGLLAHADHVNLAVQAGLCDESTGACQFTTGIDASPTEQGTLGYTLRIVPLGTALAGGWQQFVVHVHWATDSAGLVEGWWRPRGGTWSKTVSWSGHPTVQWTTQQPAETNLVTYDKIGAYRGTSTFPISIWQDGFCVATSFSAAAGCL